jgi:hypothetical protein
VPYEYYDYDCPIIVISIPFFLWVFAIICVLAPEKEEEISGD